MKRRPRIYYSDSQKALMWERWKQGWTLHEIGKLFDRSHPSIQRILAESGGIRPAGRVRAVSALTLAEREEISRSMATGESIRSIAARLGRAPSTISREIRRNGGSEGYRANQAGLGYCGVRPLNLALILTLRAPARPRGSLLGYGPDRLEARANLWGDGAVTQIASPQGLYLSHGPVMARARSGLVPG